MPPKRKPASVVSDDKPSGSPTKKQKLDPLVSNDSTKTTSVSSPPSLPPSVAPPPSLPPKSKDDSDIDSSEDEAISDGRPYCVYGVGCYRKNPDHRKQFRHPASVVKKTKKKEKKDEEGGDKAGSKDGDKGKGKDEGTTKKEEKDDVEGYRNVLKITLSKNKISADEKRLLRAFRKNHDIDDAKHFQLLLQFGWSPEEFDDGEKKDDDIDMDEEREVINKGGFSIITIKKSKNMPKQHENVFSRVCTKFFQTMSTAQANYNISEVGVIVNSEWRKKFSLKKQEFQNLGEANLEWAFHGTTRESIKAIAETGFLHPNDLPKQKDITKGKKAKKSKIEILDEGFFGKGIYFSFYSDYAMYYSETRSSDQILLSQVLPGKAYQCKKRMDGENCVKGYNSHYSPKGNEIIIFQPEQVLPRYIITFKVNEDEEREQEC